MKKTREIGSEVVEWADRNSGTIATVASVASFAVPGAGFVAVGFGAWSAYGSVREGDFIGAGLDVVGVVAGGAAIGLAGRSAALTEASSRALVGRGYLAPWLAADAARYASAARGVSSLSFGLSALSQLRGFLGDRRAAAMATDLYGYC